MLLNKRIKTYDLGSDVEVFYNYNKAFITTLRYTEGKK